MDDRSYHGQPYEAETDLAGCDVVTDILSDKASATYCSDLTTGRRAIADADGCGMPQSQRRGDWIQTFSGRQYWPLDPRPEDIELEDVAHHLGMLCRYTGACRRFYSVAEHSVHVLALIERHLHGNEGLPRDQERRLKRHALLHDGPEAYINDIARPVKRSITGYDRIEMANTGAFAQRFDLWPAAPGEWDAYFEHADIVKLADNAMLLAEQNWLMAAPPVAWAPVIVPAAMLEHAHRRLADVGSNGWSPDRAKWEFLQAWERVKPL